MICLRNISFWRTVSSIHVKSIQLNFNFKRYGMKRVSVIRLSFFQTKANILDKCNESFAHETGIISSP